MSRPNSSVPNGWARDGARKRSGRLWARGSWGATHGARTAAAPSKARMTHATSPARYRPSLGGRAAMASSNLHGGIWARKGARSVLPLISRVCPPRYDSVAQMLLLNDAWDGYLESETWAG